MERREFEAFAAHCVQDDPPPCQVACPLRVDVRGFLARLAAGDLAGGRKLLERTMPLPAILARICDHPCETACLRSRRGGALAVGALERACLEATVGGKTLVLPRKSGRIAVLGAGVSPLVAAWDLARKGYAVTWLVAGDQPGGRLAELSEAVLPRRVLDEELARLTSRGVGIKTGQVLDPACLEAVCRDQDAVYVAMDEGPGFAGFSPGAMDALTLATGRPGVFCGGWPQGAGRYSPARLAAQGRTAAVSVDRYLGKVSLTASRGEAVQPASRLAPRLDDVAALPRLVPRDRLTGAYAPDEARQEAGRCLHCQCLDCLWICPYLRHYQAYPKAYAQQIYNNLSIVQGNRTGNTLINSCMLCGLCTEICPEGFSMATLCLRARREMVDGGTMPLSVHEFALEDMAFANGPEFALFRAEPGSNRCAHLFFPGCQLGGEPEGKIPATYAFLREKLSGGVGLALGCCGVPALWAGREALFQETMAGFVRQWEALGRPRLVTACASCAGAFAQGAPHIPVISLWRVLAEETGRPEPSGPKPSGPLAVHDPCASRHDQATQAAVRDLLHGLGLVTHELPLSRNRTPCCGYGGLLGNVDPALATVVTAELAGQSRDDFVATCAMCRDRLAKVGKRAYHLLDLLFPGREADPGARPDPGFSRRHEERSRLRRELLATVWNEPGEPQDPAGSGCILAPGVGDLLEARHILVADAARVVAEAMASGRYLLDRASGRRLASFRPRRVTFWVEYTPEAASAVVHTAYAHRMAVIDAGGEADPANISMVYLPQAGDWGCGACGGPLEPAAVRVSYLKGGFSITLLACRRCRLALVPEYLAMGKMHEVEQLMEEK